MSTINVTQECPDLLAELQLATCYPEEKWWDVVYMSTFKRNFSNDVLKCEPERHKAFLSRNGISDVLPEKLFFGENLLRFKDNRELRELVAKIKDEQDRIWDFFLPFDSVLFNRSIRLSEDVTELIGNKYNVLLKRIFNYDLEAETNPYIRLIAPLLLQVTSLRGDFERLTGIINVILGCKVEFKIQRYETVLFTIHKLNLNTNEYFEYNKVLKPFFDFVEYWFLPMELNCIFKVKDYQQPLVLSDTEPLILDYNTNLK